MSDTEKQVRLTASSMTDTEIEREIDMFEKLTKLVERDHPDLIFVCPGPLIVSSFRKILKERKNDSTSA